MGKITTTGFLELSKMLSTEPGKELAEALNFLSDLANLFAANLRNGLTVEYNMNALVSTVSLTDGVEQIINYDQRKTIFSVSIARTVSTQYGYQSLLWYINDSNQLAVKVGFTGSPTAPVDTVLVIQYR